ncbi:MAG: hypothetical protein R2815_03335 [Flavobacteriales bacterium]
MRSIGGIALCIPAVVCAQAWEAGVSFKLDTARIRIGEQVTLLMEVEGPRADAIQWPAFNDTISRHIEVISDSGVDTLLRAGRTDHLELLRELKLTSFDTGRWTIPPYRFTIGGKPLETVALTLEVLPVALDSTLLVHDIREIYTVPFSIRYWLRTHWEWFAYGAGALVLAALILWWALRERPAPITAPVPVEEIPLHERVLAELRALGEQRLWQHGAHKEYQSRLTDVLRGYIEARYKVPALERTTEELMHELRVSPLTRDQQTMLGNLLRSADMVKFAKALPSPAENEQMMNAAVAFVLETKAATQRPPSDA